MPLNQTEKMSDFELRGLKGAVKPRPLVSELVSHNTMYRATSQFPQSMETLRYFDGLWRRDICWQMEKFLCVGVAEPLAFCGKKKKYLGGQLYLFLMFLLIHFNSLRFVKLLWFFQGQ